MTVLIIIFLIVLDGYFSLAEMALVSVSKTELEEDNLRDDPRAKKALTLIKNPEEFLSTIQVGSTLLELVQGIYGGSVAAEGIKRLLEYLGLGNAFSDIISLMVGVGLITYVSIVFGELVPKSIALQVPLRTALWVATPLSWFARFAFPFIKILTFSTHKILGLLHIKSGNKKNISERELRKMLGTAYQQGTLQKEQLWLHQNVFTLNTLTAGRIMKPISIIAKIDSDWSRDMVQAFIKMSPYSNFPVYHPNKKEFIGILETKNFLLNNSELWQDCISGIFSVRKETPVWTIFTEFNRDMKKFALVTQQASHIGILTMQDIMEAIFGDIPELEDYSSYLYPKSANHWMADGFIHLQRIRKKLSLNWLRSYEEKYFTLAELISGESANVDKNGILHLQGIKFEILSGDIKEVRQVAIKLP